MSTVRQEFAQLHDVLNRTLMLLDEASALVEPAGIWPAAPTIGLLERAKNEVLQARSNLHVARANAGPVLIPSPAIDSPVVAAPLPEIAGKTQRMRGRFVIRGAADVNRLLPRLAVPWKLPRIEVGIHTLPSLEVQRLQDRITRIHGSREQQILGPVAAGAVILIGSFRIVLTHNPWTSAQELKDFETVFFVAFLAWLAGRLVEIIWSRLRLVRVLLRLRRTARGWSATSDHPAAP